MSQIKRQLNEINSDNEPIKCFRSKFNKYLIKCLMYFSNRIIERS